MQSAALAAVAAGPLHRALAQDAPGDRSIRQYLAARAAEIEREFLPGVKTAADFERLRPSLCADFFDMLGLKPMPERTPLQATVTGKVEQAGYTLEKLHFQSLPGLYVTANLYLPRPAQERYPTILYQVGHYNGHRRDGNKVAPDCLQQGTWFATHGYVALMIDTIELSEIAGLHRGLLAEKRWWHSMGYTPAGVETWNAIRALDYLVTCPEVDAARIGCTGNSGGGTMTAYLSALDDRIQVAAPSCFLTNWKSLLETIGPQDAEQNLPPWLADGLDQPGFVLAFAPKPMLMLSAIRDFFTIAGVRETFREGKRIYGLLSADEKLQMVEADDGHGYTLPRRLAAYRWMNRWLKGVDAPIVEPEMEIESEADLRCTEAGQITLALGGETIFSLNRAEAQRVKPPRAALTTPDELQRLQQEIRTQAVRLTAFARPANKPTVNKFGQIARDGYHIEKLRLASEPGITIPALLFVPDGVSGKRRALLYAHENGKATEAKAGAEIEALVRSGLMVLAIDLRGLGETHEEADRLWDEFGTFNSAMTALLSGKTLVGLRAQDVISAVDMLTARNDVELESLTAYGNGAAAVVVLHAAALDERIKRVTLEEMLVSYEAVSTWKIHHQIFADIVPGALAAYDLPDLAASFAPRKLTIINAVNPRRNPMALREVRQQYQVAQQAFAVAGAAQSLIIAERKPGQKLAAWLP